MLDGRDDMEELFRRAAENYPLKTDGSRWDVVHDALRTARENSEQPKKSRGRKFLWLLMLLPLGMVCNRYINTGNDSTSGIEKTTSVDESSSAAKQQKAIESGGENQGAGDEKNIALNAPVKKLDPRIEPGPALTGKYRSSSDLKKSVDKEEREQSSLNPRVMAHANTLGSLHENSDIEVSQPPQSQANSITDNENNASTQQEEKLLPDQLAQTEAREVLMNNGNNKTGEEVKSSSIISRPASEMSSDTATELGKSIKFNSNNITYKRFYAGLVAGPDISTVKYDKVSKIGLSAGVVIGYQINKKLSVETGLLWDKKFYNSEGKYFSTKRLTIPGYVKIIELDGECNMYELPVSLKYDFASRNKSTWFASLGASSYFMKKESYSYTYLSYGQQHSRFVSYNNSSTNWFSLFNVSIGYTYKAGKNTLLRVQPYIKSPLKGVGIGSLPITSAGLYAGVTRTFF